jgi:hypothetical protein
VVKIHSVCTPPRAISNLGSGEVGSERLRWNTSRHRLFGLCNNVWQKSLNFWLDSGSTWLDGVNGILMQQEPNSSKQDYWNRRAIASLANTLITVMEPVPTPLLSSMLLLQL